MNTTKIFRRALGRQANVTNEQQQFVQFKLAIVDMQLRAMAKNVPDVEIKPITFAYVRATDETCLMEAK